MPSDVEAMCQAANCYPTPRRFVELIKWCEALGKSGVRASDKIISIKPVVNADQVLLENPFGSLRTERDDNNNLLFC